MMDFEKDMRKYLADCKVEKDDIDEIMRMISAEIDDAEETAHDEGFDEGVNSVDIEPDLTWMDDLETALLLIDTDRTAAKVYLDRCTRTAGKYLREVAPCL
jgi:hypothetical protein